MSGFRTKSKSARGWTSVLCGALLGIALLSAQGGTTARAADDDDEAFDTKILRNILRGMGLRRDGDTSGIDYRERSPLVVPPARELRPPETTSAVNTPSWPTDADVKRSNELKAARKKPRKSVEEEAVALTPDQLRPTGRNTGPNISQAPTGSSKDPTLPSTMSELGTKSIFTWGALWGHKEEYGTFAGEPPRASLTEPPSGYRTPSPAQPYGVGKEKYAPTALNPLDSAAMRGMDR